MVINKLSPEEKRLIEQKNILIHTADPKYASIKKEGIFVCVVVPLSVMKVVQSYDVRVAEINLIGENVLLRHL